MLLAFPAEEKCLDPSSSFKGGRKKTAEETSFLLFWDRIKVANLYLSVVLPDLLHMSIPT